MRPEHSELSNSIVQRYHDQFGEPSSLGHRGMNSKTQFAKGVGMTGLILVTITYVLLGFVGGWGIPLWWTVLFFGIVFACGLATPTALQLLRQGFAGRREAKPDRHRSLKPGDSAIAPAMTVRDEKHAERQLLEAIERQGEITPARAAIETTLTVAEAERLLYDLAHRGHLEIRVEGGKLAYTL